VKRAFDLALALLLLLPAAIVVAIAAIAVVLDSPGPPIFKQRRIGRGQVPFTMLKLRTMTHETATAASHEVPKSAVTRAGALLRRTKIDELPQIWSVLVGDMSFVGPRPCLEQQFELIREREARGVFQARPGITGPAQLAGIDMSTPKRLAEADGNYVTNRSLTGDLVILLRTLAGHGSGDAVR
jgi:lipopolysaccharide/colanic/teichoic acid biosynthesis glycosyltransferase